MTNRHNPNTISVEIVELIQTSPKPPAKKQLEILYCKLFDRTSRGPLSSSFDLTANRKRKLLNIPGLHL